jgi:hypothetical protein
MMTDGITEIWWLMKKRDDARSKRKTLSMLLAGERIVKLSKSIHQQLREIYTIRRPDRQRTNRITLDMIEQARQYPLEDLYPFKGHMAVCPFHNDRNPSMSLKNNRVRCWGCGWSGDTIAFLMAKEGVGFTEAVRRLC